MSLIVYRTVNKKIEVKCVSINITQNGAGQAAVTLLENDTGSYTHQYDVHLHKQPQTHTYLKKTKGSFYKTLRQGPIYAHETLGNSM